jgi:hypothetical protein
MEKARVAAMIALGIAVDSSKTARMAGGESSLRAYQGYRALSARYVGKREAIAVVVSCDSTVATFGLFDISNPKVSPVYCQHFAARLYGELFYFHRRY